jgi:hypothetical protein
MLRLFAVVAFVLLAASARAESVTVDVNGAEIALSTPAGHCALDRAHPAERGVLKTVERAVASSNRVLLGFADCSQLAELREGRRRLLDDFGQYMTPLRGNQLDMNPAAFAQQMTEVFKAQGAELMQGAEAEVREKVAGMRMGVRMGEHRLLGVLRSDRRASYLGIVQSIGLPDRTTKVQVGIVAMGLVKQRIVSLNLYTPFSEGAAGAAATVKLLEVSVSTYANFAGANGQ